MHETANRPVDMTPPRLAALAKLPVFFDLGGRRVLVIGGGEPALWKAELLLSAGAQVEIVAPHPHPDVSALVAASPRAVLDLRDWRESDLDGAALVVADVEDEEAERLAALARRRGIPLNVIDKPRYCDFQFGTIVNRSPVVIGIMTDGAAPILGQAIRRRIEAILPASLATWAAAAKAFRGAMRARLTGKAERRVFWELFVDTAFAGPPARQGAAAVLDRLAQEVLSNATEVLDGATGDLRGSVAIIGAGPGDPELLTLKAMRELQAADVIVYDRLVTPEVLELGRREARRIHVGKEGHGAACRQDDICALLVDLALAGERVVRLKGGDPAIFGRTGEEVAACREAGVPVRVVPGITTASAAAASLAVSLTHRDHAQRVQFVTGHDRRGALPADLDFDALADRRATVVVYMGRRTAGPLADALMARGLPAGTPVLAIADVSRPEQQVVATDLASLTHGVGLPVGRPIILMIGESLRLDPATEPVRPASGRVEPPLGYAIT